MLQGEPLSLPIAGSGVIFLASAVISVSSGALAELVFKLGDVREHEFARLTQKSDRPGCAPRRPV